MSGGGFLQSELLVTENLQTLLPAAAMSHPQETANISKSAINIYKFL